MGEIERAPIMRGSRAMGELLALTDPPTAVIAAADTLSLGASETIRNAGLHVPDDFAVVSFDDPFFGDLLDPPMTALRRDEDEIGEIAASLLLKSLDTGALGPAIEVRIQAELVVRRSCGCA